MKFPSLHPRLDELTAFANDSIPPARRREMATHVSSCVACQDSLRFLATLNAAVDAPAAAAPPEILARALASRAAGERRIVSALSSTSPPSRWQRRALGVVAAAILTIAVIFVTRTPELSAVVADSEMQIGAAPPPPGDTIRIAYRPVPGLFARETSLVVRARLRTAVDEMYAYGVPPRRTRQVTTLRRGRNGSFEGAFVLPDSVVFASLAVEDPAAARVDDNEGRLWEVVTHDATGEPTYDAIAQRANDMMGRSWEAAYASARQLAELYPDRPSAWTLRQFFESAMFGKAGADSIGKSYQAKLAALVAAAKAKPALSEPELGDMFYQAFGPVLRSGSPADSVEHRYWLARLRREYPKHPQLAQYEAVSFNRRDWDQPAAMLDSLERIYRRFAPLTGSGRLVNEVAIQVAARADTVAYRRWIERSLQAAPDSAFRAALSLSSRPAYRDEAMTNLRKLLTAPPEMLVPVRALEESQSEYSRRVADTRRRALAALGRALVATGRTKEGLDTLGVAARGAWDPQLFRSLKAAFLTAGDSASARAIGVRLMVDPRSEADSVAKETATLRATMGAPWLDSATAAARNEMYAILLERSSVRGLRGSPHVAEGSNDPVALREVTGGKPAVVIFWSAACSWAIDALPAITATAQRLRASGTPVVFVAGDGPSPEATKLLAEKKWTLPVYYDKRGEMKKAFANFGTPAYYVLDRAGRIRFSRANGEAELIAQVRALQSEMK